MRLLLNVIWLIFGGLWLALGYFAAGIICFILIITIPFGFAAFRIGVYALWPFGYTVVDKPGYVMGTAEYTSPERVSGRRPEDARSDLFSLGCVLYEMLAGKTPFPGGVRQLMKEAGSDLSPNMDALLANLPDDVIGVLRRSLAAYPSDRFATARAMSAALIAAIEKLAAAA